MQKSLAMWVNVSIHAPRVGCDSLPRVDPQRVRKFQFTHPVWGATDAL